MTIRNIYHDSHLHLHVIGKAVVLGIYSTNQQWHHNWKRPFICDLSFSAKKTAAVASFLKNTKFSYFFIKMFTYVKNILRILLILPSNFFYGIWCIFSSFLYLISLLAIIAFLLPQISKLCFQHFQRFFTISWVLSKNKSKYENFDTDICKFSQC